MTSFSLLKLHAQTCFPVDFAIFFHSSYAVEHMRVADSQIFVISNLGADAFKDGEHNSSPPFQVSRNNFLNKKCLT